MSHADDSFPNALPVLSGARRLSDAAALASLMGVMAWASLSLARSPGVVAAVWVGNGILVGWLLSRPTRQWPGLIASGLLVDYLVRLAVGGSPFISAAICGSNLVEAMIVAVSVRRAVPDIGNPRKWLGLGRVATGSTLVACAISGVMVATVLSSNLGSSFKRNLLTWYAAHVVGMVIVATFTLVAHREKLRLFAVSGRPWDFVGTVLLLGVVSGAVFYQSRFPLLFLVFPPLLWCAFRHRFAGVVVGVSLLALIGSVATALGTGPLALVRDASDFERIILLQLFIGTACIMVFPVALAMAERNRLLRRVRENETRYRLLADYSHDVIVRIRQDGQRLYVSPSSTEMLGLTPEELLQSRWDLVHPEDRDAQRQAMNDVLASGKTDTSIYRVQHKNGEYVWIEAVARPIPSVDVPGTMDVIYTCRDVSRRVAAEQALLASQAELEALARTDGLTGLPNRRQFDERLQLAVTRARRRQTMVGLMYLDVDHFKSINDTFGHGAGDQVLRQFAGRLQRSVRADDLVARLGGDEFAVLIEEAGSSDAMATIAAKLIDSMVEPIAFDASAVQVSTSVGIALSTSAADCKALLAAADAALYAAKKAGRNCFRLQLVAAATTS